MRFLFLLIFIPGLAPWAQDQTKEYFPVAAPQYASGTAFDTTSGDAEPRILTGLLISTLSPFTAVAPLTANLEADGTLSKSRISPWKGPVPPHSLRVEKPGFVLAGGRFLLVISGKQAVIQQFQPFWLAFKEGQTTGKIVVGVVYGSPAKDKDQTLVGEIALAEGQIPLGLHGFLDNRHVNQFSLVAKGQKKVSSGGAIKTTNEVSSKLPTFVVPPQAPQVPQVKLSQ